MSRNQQGDVDHPTRRPAATCGILPCGIYASRGTQYTVCMYNPRRMYDLLFQSAWHTIKTLSNNPQWIGAKPAATMILHTWSQKLMLHPHVHCIVPNGGLTTEGKWQYPKKGKDNFLYPVDAMKRLYRGYFMDNLKSMYEAKLLNIPKGYLEKHGGYKKLKDLLYAKDWVVFTKKPFSQAKHVIDYLGRYSHRVAITNRRIKNYYRGQSYCRI